MTPAYSVTTDGRTFDPSEPRYADPSPADKAQAAAFRQILRSDPPGFQTDNRLKQAQHLKGIIYIAIRAIRNLAGGATYEATKRVKKKNGKTTFGPNGTVAKSLSAPQAQGRDEDYTPFDDEDHPLVRMLKRPNPTETFGELSAKLVLQNRLTGVGPLWTVPNEKHKPVELWSLKTPLMYPAFQQTQQYPNGAWRVVPYMIPQYGFLPSRIGATGATIPGEEVKRFMEPHPYIDWDGYSPLTAGDKQLDVLESIDEARKASMDNGVVLGTYVLVPGANQEQLDRMVTDMLASHGGSKKHKRFGAFAFGTPESKGTIQTDTQRPVDMEYESGWEQMVKFCLALFGVPASVAGLNPAASYSEHYAARQQFHDEQADYLEALATFLTKTLAWPWCSFPDEYLVRVKPRPINDREMKEKQHARQDTNGTITLDESRAMDDLDPWEDPEVGKLPVQIALEVIKNKVAPEPVMGPDGQPMDPNAVPPGADDQPQDAQGLQDAIADEAVATLGVPPDDATGAQPGAANGQPQPPANGQTVGKAFTGQRGPWDESKHKRDHGKFSSTGGSSGLKQAGPQQAKWQQYQSGAGSPEGKWGKDYISALQQGQQGQGGPTPPPLPPGKGPGDYYGTHPGAKPPPLPPRAQHTTPPASRAEHAQRVKQSAPRVATMAGNIPEGADVLASAGRWAAAAADKHADRVAAHLGISRDEAHSLVRTTIEQLCNVAQSINSSGTAQKTVRGASGKRLKFAVRGSGPTTRSGKVKTDNRGSAGSTTTGGGPPRPSNPMGAGSRPPLPGIGRERVKQQIASNTRRKSVDGMSGLDNAGFLVPEVHAVRKRKRKKRRGVGAYLRKALEELEE